MIGYGLLGLIVLSLVLVIRVSLKMAVLRSDLKYLKENSLHASENTLKEWISLTIELNILLAIVGGSSIVLFLFAYGGAI